MVQSIHDIKLTPKPGKKYWRDCHRESREEFIYFVLVDRFHDNNKRHSLEYAKRSGFGEKHQLQKNCGGTLLGIIDHIEYILNKQNDSNIIVISFFA